jgi:hypothetical protein
VPPPAVRTFADSKLALVKIWTSGKIPVSKDPPCRVLLFKTKAKDPPPTVARYGYRGDDRSVPEGRYPRDGYEDAWIYQATDQPNITIPTEFAVPAGTRFQIEARFNGQIVDLASGEVVIEKGANVTWCALPTPNIWVGKERLVLHDGARAGSRTLNLGIKSLSTGSLREDQRGSGSLNRS